MFDYIDFSLILVTDYLIDGILLEFNHYWKILQTYNLIERLISTLV